MLKIIVVIPREIQQFYLRYTDKNIQQWIESRRSAHHQWNVYAENIEVFSSKTFSHVSFEMNISYDKDHSKTNCSLKFTSLIVVLIVLILHSVC